MQNIPNERRTYPPALSVLNITKLQGRTSRGFLWRPFWISCNSVYHHQARKKLNCTRNGIWKPTEQSQKQAMPIVSQTSGLLLLLLLDLVVMTFLAWDRAKNKDYFSSGFLLIASLAMMPTGLHIVLNTSYEPWKGAINVFNVLVFTFVRKKSDILAVYEE